MYAFVDESAYPRSSDSSDFSVLLAVCIGEEEHQKLSNDLTKLKQDIYRTKIHWESLLNLKAKNLITPRTIEKSRTKNKEMIDRVFSLISQTQIAFYALVMEWPPYVPFVAEDRLAPHYVELLWRLDIWAKTTDDAGAKPGYESSTVTIIFGEQGSYADHLKAKQFYNTVSKLRSLDSITATPFFVCPGTSAGLELADVAAGVVRHYHNARLHISGREAINQYHKWIKELYGVIESKTKMHIVNGTSYPGIQVLSRNYFPERHKFFW